MEVFPSTKAILVNAKICHRKGAGELVNSYQTCFTIYRHTATACYPGPRYSTSKGNGKASRYLIHSYAPPVCELRKRRQDAIAKSLAPICIEIKVVKSLKEYKSISNVVGGVQYGC